MKKPAICAALLGASGGVAIAQSPSAVLDAADEDGSRALKKKHTVNLPSGPNVFLDDLLSVPFLRVGVFDAQSLMTIPHAKTGQTAGKLVGAQLSSVARAVCLWLRLPVNNFRPI
jgi:hypothetical protein